MRWLAVVAGICCLAMLSAAEPLSDIDLSAFEGSELEDQLDIGASPFVAKSQVADDILVDDLFLEGTIIGDKGSYALLSGNVVERGDRIAGYRLTTVGETYVDLKKRDEKITLHIGVGRSE